MWANRKHRSVIKIDWENGRATRQTSRSREMADWYAVQTKARQEAIAEQHLGNQAFHTFLPLLRIVRHRRGRWQGVIEPLFPGYLFVELDIEQQNAAPIRSTRGVISLVRHGGIPRPIPTHIIEPLIDAQHTHGEAIEPEKLFKAGDKVTLIDGPFAGLTAIFEAKSSQERVILMLNMLGGQTRVSVSAHDIKLAG